MAMTTEFIPYPKIGQFDSVITRVRSAARKASKDKWIYDEGAPDGSIPTDCDFYFDTKEEIVYKFISDTGEWTKLDKDPFVYPTITFQGAVKAHGTNAAFHYTLKEGMLCARRKALLGKESLTAHQGFNQWAQVNNNEDVLFEIKRIFDYVTFMKSDEEKENTQLIVSGEWAGANIQGGVGLCKLPKKFLMFDVSTINIETREIKWYNMSTWRFKADDMHNITEFGTYSIDIDFNNPQLASDELGRLTQEVEDMCPITRHFIEPNVLIPLTRWERIKNFFGADFKPVLESFVGEGIVWKAEFLEKRLVFKVKGSKHSDAKRSVKAPISAERVVNEAAFVDYACTENRMAKCIQSVKEELELNVLTRANTGDIVKWISQDIIAEETEALKESGLEWKNVHGQISTRMREYFFEHLQSKVIVENKD